MHLAIVIPAYNAERKLEGVLDRIARVPLSCTKTIIVVNDGSRDGTLGLLDDLIRRTDLAPLQVIHRAQNGGYGAAMQDGLEHARISQADVVACVHADGQYSPEVLPMLLEALTARRLDILQGSRIAAGTALSGGMPLYKYIGNALLNQLENLTFGLDMTDYHSGYLLYSRRALEVLSFGQLSKSFDFDLEVIASARAHGLAVAEAPVPTHYGDEISYLNPVSYGLRVLRVLWRYQRGVYGPRPASNRGSALATDAPQRA
ncbi:MAG TPA: glycosyltransferase family 2 protein [Polyangiaceae bacterium]|nr:glycosyltransferase family 2 protein [Polyangiaceae bacterium]